MTKNGRPVPDLGAVGDVPIIGESVWMACPRGHVQHLRKPFTLNVGASKPIEICGVCWLNFVGMFAARPLEQDEIQALKEANELEENL